MDNKEIGNVISTDKETYEKIIKTAEAAFIEWRNWPAPKEEKLCVKWAMP